jgi:hypothetical protein
MKRSQFYMIILYDYPTQMPWKTEDVDYKISRIASDIRYLQEVKSILTTQQQEELHFIQNRIISSMQTNSYDTARINSAFQVVFASS